MDELINIVNKLQDVFAASGMNIDLPQIVVVGAQSSGKSSVLEHIVGKSFLPRGTGIVTRCPLFLQMVPTTGKGSQDEYAIFQHNKTKVFTDYGLIQKEIEAQTNRIAGVNKGICQTPISLKLFSPSFLTLTLVDLPGLTKVPVGDQPPDIEQQTRNLTLAYIKNPNSIILAVMPANADMATSESLKIAREVDPEGYRTLAVITKLDLMDEGTDAWDMLTGKVIPVKLGIIGVVNRSQKDIQDEKSVKVSLNEEVEFLKKRYTNIADRHGSLHLTKTVQRQLANHVRDCLPRLKQGILQRLSIKQEELRRIGESKIDKTALLLDLMTTFSQTFILSIKGTLADIKTKEIYGGARIRYVFEKTLSNALKSIDALEGLTKADILTAMENASGITATMFVSESTFELLIKKQIERLRHPCLQCVDLVDKELARIMNSCIDDQRLRLDRFPKLQTALFQAVTELLQDQLPATKQMVDRFVDAQLAYINTSHPDFLPNSSQMLNFPMFSGDGNEQVWKHLLVSRKTSLTEMGHQNDNLRQGRTQLNQPPSQEKGNRDYMLIQELIQSYFAIVRKTVQDTIPKIIMLHLVNYVVDHLQLELVARLYKRDVEEILQEAKEFTDMRRELKAKIKSLEDASRIIDSLKSVQPRDTDYKDD